MRSFFFFFSVSLCKTFEKKVHTCRFKYANEDLIALHTFTLVELLLCDDDCATSLVFQSDKLVYFILYFFSSFLAYIALWSQRINKKHMRKFTENYFNFTHESSRFAVVIQYVYEIVAAEERAISILFFCIIFWRTLNSFHKKIYKKKLLTGP